MYPTNSSILYSKEKTAQILGKGGSRGRVQGGAHHPPPEMTCGFLIQLVFCKKKLCGLMVLKQSKRRAHPLLKKILDPSLRSKRFQSSYCAKIRASFLFFLLSSQLFSTNWRGNTTGHLGTWHNTGLLLYWALLGTWHNTYRMFLASVIPNKSNFKKVDFENRLLIRL